MKGYMLIDYEDLKSFGKTLGTREEVCRTNPGALFEKLWFISNVDGAIMVHEYMGKPPELDEFIKKEDLKTINASYEWVK